MPTLDEWNSALSLSRYLHIDSTDALADRVNQKQGSPSFTGDPKDATGLPEFTPPRMIRVTPLELLFTLGRITTPRIENLADLCSTWARIRYIWAFVPDPVPSNLRLSEEAKDIDFHQKALLSDEIGVGMSALIVERYFSGVNPVDVDVALQNHIIPGLRNQYRTSPDYLFERVGGGYIVVECKGTQSGRYNALKQLKRGTEQVPSLVFPAGDEPLAMVISTILSDDDTIVYIIDPPGIESSKKDPRKFTIQDEQKFLHDLEMTQLSNLFLYAGATSLAVETIPYEKSKARLRKLEQRDQPPIQLEVEEMHDNYVGISQEVNLIGEVNHAIIFQGLAEKVFDALEKRDKSAILLEANNHFEKAKLLSRDANLRENERQQDIGTYFVDRYENSLLAEVFGRDGSILRIEFNRQ